MVPLRARIAMEAPVPRSGTSAPVPVQDGWNRRIRSLWGPDTQDNESLDASTRGTAEACATAIELTNVHPSTGCPCAAMKSS